MRIRIRTRPYTPLGIKRCRCAHCGQMGCEEGWSTDFCVEGNHKHYYPLCPKCDAKIQFLVMTFLNTPYAKQKIKKYRDRMKG